MEAHTTPWRRFNPPQAGNTGPIAQRELAYSYRVFWTLCWAVRVVLCQRQAAWRCFWGQPTRRCRARRLSRRGKTAHAAVCAACSPRWPQIKKTRCSMSSASGACRVSTSGRSARQLAHRAWTPALLGRRLDCAHPPLTLLQPIHPSRCADRTSSSSSSDSSNSFSRRLLLPPTPPPPPLLLPPPHLCPGPAATLPLDPQR